MSPDREQLESLLQKILGGCSLEKLEFYVSALGRVRQGLEHACQEGRLSQEEADQLLSRWLTE
jgi:hypothetical protein